MTKPTTPPVWERTLTMTEPEEQCLVTMARFFIENGWIDDDNQAAFDSLIEKICDPAPWDYDPIV
tara:strand:+ start:409 stop:603 length:195 start_codon:yes stop_codon:yes gene_type:complete